jgi:branched-chain amino acid aminotransferase
MVFPPAPLESINWNQLGLSIQDKVNGHVESTYTVSTGEWSEPTFIADPFLRVHGLSPALNYGQQAYEGMKAHRGPDGNILLFRPTAHADRLAVSTSYVSIPEIPQEHFLKCAKLAVAKNAEWVAPHSTEALLYIRPVVFGSSGHLMLTAPTEYKFAVYVQPGTTYHGVQPLPACVVEDFDRAAPRGTGGAKVGGNYAPVIRHTDKARAKGFHVTLHLDAQTRTCIEEFSTSGFIGIKKVGESVIVVVPDSKNIVQSITSDSCLALAESFGWKVEKREIPWSECKFFDEVIAVGTAASLLPIRLLARESTGEKFVYGATTGECTQRLSAALRNIMRGNIEDSFGWVDTVKEEDLLHQTAIGSEVESEINGQFKIENSANAEPTLEQLKATIEELKASLAKANQTSVEIVKAPAKEVKEVSIEKSREAPIEQTKEIPTEKAQEALVEQTQKTPVEETKAPIEETNEAPVEAQASTEEANDEEIKAIIEEITAPAAVEAPVEIEEVKAPVSYVNKNEIKSPVVTEFPIDVMDVKA